MKYKKNDFRYFQLTYPKIIETLRLVASPAETQVTVFSNDFFPPDEIVETFEHAVMMSGCLLQKHYITQEQFNSIKAVDFKFNDFSKADWTIEAMHHSDSWKTTRELANKALFTFSVSYAVPNLYWLDMI